MAAANAALETSALTGSSLFSDKEIVRRVLAGETASYEVPMRRHNQRLFRVVYSILDDRDEAEDVMQEAYVRAYAALREFEGRAQFSTWLVKIAVNEAFSRLKRRRRFGRPPANFPQEDEGMESIKSTTRDPEQEVFRGEVLSLLEQIISALPEMYRSVFICREVEEMSTGETANCLDLTEETVKVRMHRARRMLQKDLYARLRTTSSQTLRFLGARCDRVVRRVFETLAATDKGHPGRMPQTGPAITTLRQAL
jgi:RNA polymerase sigma-70 factor (ECF subfamily)